MKEPRTPEAFVFGCSYERVHRKTYRTVSAVLSDAGFDTNHEDPFIDATEDHPIDCPIESPEGELRVIQETDFVVIDLTFEDSSTKYSLQTCREVGRTYDSTLVIKQGNEPEAPVEGFAGFHFRDHVDLEKKLRLHFGMSRRLGDTQVGYVFVFRAKDADFRVQDFEAAAAVFLSLKQIRFSGRCEVYCRDEWIDNERLYVLCVGLREQSKKLHREGAFWPKFIDGVPEELCGEECGLSFIRSRSEFASIRAIRNQNWGVVAVEFEQGEVRHVNKPHFHGDSFRGLALALFKKRACEKEGRG